MKRIVLIFLAFCLSQISYSQTNTFPATGNVGIGTTTPTAKLDVNGDMSLTGNIKLKYNNSLLTENGTPLIGLRDGTIQIADDGDNNVTIWGMGGQNIKLIDGEIDYNTNGFHNFATGFVGIGVIPNNKLEINHGTAGNSGLRFTQLNSSSTTTTGNGKYLSVNLTGDVILVDGNSSSTWNLTGNSGTNPNTNFIGTSDAKDLTIRTNNIERFRVKSNGNVGIGNANPDLLLTIGGGQEPSSGIRLFDNYDGTEFWDFIVEQQIGLKIKYGTTTPFFINGFGNVGIGTTNPTTKLAVNGSIKTKEVIITLDGWSDFVFYPSYKLRTLGEVEKFIKANNHLPEIPTETEVKENGISVGEMNAKLLQKIEELTLYVIDLQKQVNQLKSKK